MKPYTLEWWLTYYGICISRMLAYASNREFNEYERYVKLHDFIFDRIVNKYGMGSMDSEVEF